MRSMGMKWGVPLAAALALGAAALPNAALADSENGQAASGKSRSAPSNRLYIVRMADKPVVAYDGSVAGYAATKPKKGAKINPNDNKVTRYASYLDGKHDAAVAGVGGRKVYGYRYAFNGFAAELTADQAEALRNAPDVLSVAKDELLARDTTTTPAFLGLSGPAGFWNTKAKGENVIIGIVDSGIWPEHPSFSDRTGTNGNGTQGGKLDYHQIPGWHGKCKPGEAFNASNCNQKLIGAQYFNAGFGGNAGVKASLPYEYNSPRDADGHGTHTSSTAGGNAGVQATGPAAVFGTVSGIAPRARISTYKVCWGRGTDGGCFGSDSVAAIDQAVADGVDVINFSISGTTSNFRDPVEIAFLFAADAGVFVAASAGNSGPASSTVAHPGPWLTTVAAGTHNRDGAGSATLGNAVTYNGGSMATLGGVGPVAFIDSVDAGLPGADPTQVALCYSSADGGAVLDPAKVAGKIVLCDRGITARVNKSLAVQEAGGVGMILVNTSANSVNADLHSVPSVHLPHTDRPAVKAYAASSGATATINTATVVLTAPAPFTASFSSRGPLVAGGGSLLKPDLIAPGQDILAGVSPAGYGGRLFDLLSGTSMSSPHVAGLGALMKELRPTWSPMAIKSALMTTGYDVLDGGTPAPNTNPVLIFRQGAGHVQPNSAADPGLVFDSGYNDWLNFICGTQPGSFCSAFTPINPSDLNVASIAIGAMAGTQTVTRRVTNVGNSTATYTASYTGMAGFTVAISPASLTLAKGASGTFTVTFTRTTAALNTYSGGQLRWTDGTHMVRVPMVVRPVALSAPAAASGSYDVTFGYTGPFSATARGLVPATTITGNVLDDPANDINTALGTGVGATIHVVNIPAGTTYARFSLFDSFTDGNDDLDLYVFNPGGSQVGGSGSGTSAEEVNLVNPAPGNYFVVVHGWQTDGADANYTLFNWNLGSADAGNMTVTAPATATIGATGTIGLAFSGLTTGTKYLGSVVYGGATGLPSPTIVRVDP